MELLFIRHGQSGNNLIWHQTGASHGRSPDPGLTDLGHQQAKALGEAFAAGEYPRPSVVYTSLMLRAVQTAAPLVQSLDLPLLGHPDIFEIHGPVQYDTATQSAGDGSPHPGASKAELTAVSDRLVWPSGVDPEGWWSGPVEQQNEVPARAAAVAADLATHGPDDVIALVSHGTFGYYLLRALLGITDMTGWIQLDNTSVSQIGQPSPSSSTGDAEAGDSNPQSAWRIARTIGRLDHLVVRGVPVSS